MIEKNKFNYVPKVDLFMERSGYKMDIFDILNEPIKSNNTFASPPPQKAPTSIEIFYYTPSDINGKI